MFTKMGLFFFAVIISFSPTAADDNKEVNPDDIKVKVVEPKEAIEAKFEDKIKVKIEVTQKKGVQAPDYVMVVLQKGESRISDWVTKRKGDKKDPYEFEYEFTMPDIQSECELYAISVYTVSPKPGDKKAKVVRVESEKIKVTPKAK